MDGLDAQNKPTKYTKYMVEWHWLPEKIANMLPDRLGDGPSDKDFQRVVHFEHNDDEVLARLRPLEQSRSSSSSTKGAKVRDKNARLIESGSRFTPLAESKNRVSTKLAIEAQWLATRMASLSGAAEAVDDLDWECPLPHEGFPILPGRSTWEENELQDEEE